MIEKLEASDFPRKYAVQFVSMDGRVSTPFYFHHHMQHKAAVTWQVLRSQFDEMLLDNYSVRKGPKSWKRPKCSVCSARKAAYAA